MQHKITRILSIIIIIILLPYVITVFINGPRVLPNRSSDGPHVRIQTENGIIEMALDEFCIGVLARDIPIYYEREALKAQAVLVRTNLYRRIQQQGRDVIFEEHFWSTRDMERAWGARDYAENHELLRTIWEETEGQIVTFEGRIATTPFHKLSNGRTRIGSEVLETDRHPYLQMRECPRDIGADMQLQTAILDLRDVEILSRDSAGYVTSVRVGEETYSGEEFRSLHNLASSSFEVQDYHGQTRLTSTGIGHGLGMSQNTANEMAREGISHLEILEFFFEGIEIKEVTEILLNTE